MMHYICFIFWFIKSTIIYSCGLLFKTFQIWKEKKDIEIIEKLNKKKEEEREKEREKEKAKRKKEKENQTALRGW